MLLFNLIKYYLYKKSPKKLRQLKGLVEEFEESYDFTEGGYKPKKASGTRCIARWIVHKIRALELIIDKYGVFMTHLKALSDDKSYSSSDRAKYNEWYKKWTNARIPLLACVSIEVLSPAKFLKYFRQKM